MSRRPIFVVLAAAALIASPRAARADASRAFIFQSDYTTGSLSSADLQPRTPHCDITPVGTDASLRWWGDRLYVVNRSSGSIQEVNPATGATLLEFSVGPGSNPHDIVFTSATKAYVSRFDATDLWIVNPVNGAHTGTISLASLADADGLPEMDRMASVGPLLFVSLERLDRNDGYAPNDTSLVAVIDTRTDALVDCDPARPGVQAIALAYRNPFTAFQWDPVAGRLLIGCVGRFGVVDGAVERIDPVALQPDGAAITEAGLGGDVNDIVWGGASKSWAIVADDLGNTRLDSWSATLGATLNTIWLPGGYVLTDAELNDRGEVWVCNGSFGSPKVRVFSATTDAQVGADVVCTLPAVAVAFDVIVGHALGVPQAGATLAFAPPAPSPAGRATRFAFTLASPGWLRLEVFDAAGRRVRTLADGAWPAGAGSMVWDLADDSGARVAPGVYPVRARAGDAEWRGRVIVTH